MYTQKDLKRMTRRNLLEILVLQNKKIDELQTKLNKANETLQSKEILLSEAGNIAEASLRINKIFETAQESANQYLDNIKRIKEEQKEILQKLEKEYDKNQKDFKDKSNRELMKK